LGTSTNVTLSIAAKSEIAQKLSIAFKAETNSVTDMLKEILIDGKGLVPTLRPMVDGKKRIYLGGLIYGDPEPKLKGGTFTDDFNRGNEALGASANWQEDEDNWSIVSNVVRPGTTYADAHLARCTNSDLASLNHYAQLDIVTMGVPSSGTARAGPTARYYDGTTGIADHYGYNYRAERTSGDVETLLLRRWLNGSGTTLFSDSWAMSLPDTIKVSANGSTIAGYLNGAEVNSTTDTAIPAGGVGSDSNYYWGGMYGQPRNVGNVEVDNWEMADLVSAPTVTTDAATSVADTTATLNGDVTDTGDGNITEHWFVWGDDNAGDPGDDPAGSSWDNTWSESGSYGTGAFSHGITSLGSGTRYYYRAGGNQSGNLGWGASGDFITTGAKFGYEGEGSTGLATVGGLAFKSFSSYSPTFNGTATSMTASISVSGYKFKYALYTTGQDLVGYTDEVDTTAAQSWVTGNFVDSPAVDNSTNYFLAFKNNDNQISKIWYDNTGTAAQYDIQSYAAAWTDPINWDGNTGTYQFSIYVNYTPYSAPTMENTGATVTGFSAATINGQVADNGGDDPTVTFYYGDEDGGETPGAWDDSVAMGVQSGSFSTDLTSLNASIEGATYYYRVYGTND
ncbi:hypothetical protein LCGC14_2206080, partial [marine sediment metagenome]